MGADPAQFSQSLHVALSGRSAVPIQGDGFTAGNALSGLVKPANSALCFRVSVFRQGHPFFDRRAVVALFECQPTSLKVG
jgi:hypothetical protein